MICNLADLGEKETEVEWQQFLGIWAPRSPKEAAYTFLSFHTLLQDSPWLWLYTGSYWVEIHKTPSKCLWFTHGATRAHCELQLWVRGAGLEFKLHDLGVFTLEPLSLPVKWEYYVIHRNGSITLFIRPLQRLSQVHKGPGTKEVLSMKREFSLLSLIAPPTQCVLTW